MRFAFAALLLIACGSWWCAVTKNAVDPVSFDDVAERAGVQFTLRNAATPEKHQIFRNTSPDKNHWISFLLVGRLGNRNAIGARVHMVSASRIEQPRQHIGRLRVFADLPADRQFTIVEP